MKKINEHEIFERRCKKQSYRLSRQQRKMNDSGFWNLLTSQFLPGRLKCGNGKCDTGKIARVENAGVSRMELEFSLLTAFHMLSLLHFPLPHFQRPLSADIQSDPVRAENEMSHAAAAAAATSGITTYTQSKQSR